MDALPLPIAAAELVPHRKPMLLIERMVAIDGKNGVVEAEIAEDFLFLTAEGQVEEVAMIELIAQGYAAIKGYADRLSGLPVRQGFLVGIKTFKAYQPVKLGDRLRIELKTVAELDDFALAEGIIQRSGDVVADAEIKIWIQ